MNNKIYEKITQSLIEGLEKGRIPWKMPYKMALPQSIHGKTYKGGNRFILQYVAMDKNYKSNKWATFNQISKIGGSIKKGEKATPICFYKIDEIEDEKTGEKKKRFFLRYYNVFNISQTDLPINEKESKKPENREALKIQREYMARENIQANTEHKGVPCYIPAQDKIYIPSIDNFKTENGFHSTFFHEMVHSTGHKNRLNRKGIAEVNSADKEKYSYEELIAEIGASFLCNDTNTLNTEMENKQAYINGWIQHLKNHPDQIVRASNHAEKAVNFIYGEQEA